MPEQHRRPTAGRTADPKPRPATEAKPEPTPEPAPQPAAKAKGGYKVKRTMLRDLVELHAGDSISFREGEEEHVAQLLRDGVIERA